MHRLDLPAFSVGHVLQFQTVTGQSCYFLWIVSHQTNLFDAQITQKICAPIP